MKTFIDVMFGVKVAGGQWVWCIVINCDGDLQYSQ